MKVYHFTCNDLSEFAGVGVQCYPINPENRPDKRDVVRYLQRQTGSTNGIWVWPELFDNVEMDAFIWKLTSQYAQMVARLKNGPITGTLLELKVLPGWLLSTQLRQTGLYGSINFTHTLDITTPGNGTKKVHKQPFDICTQNVTDFRPVKQIRLEVSDLYIMDLRPVKQARLENAEL